MSRLCRRMPLRCGWMYANAIIPTKEEWTAALGGDASLGAGRLSGLYASAAGLDELSAHALAFSERQNEGPMLMVNKVWSGVSPHAYTAMNAMPCCMAMVNMNAASRVTATARYPG